MTEKKEGVILAFLSHHGVKGQRWGVRRTKAALARASRREGREVSPEAARAKLLKKKKRKELTNEELKFLNERLNLERNNSQLNPTAVAQGAKKTKALVATLGVAVTLSNYARTPAGQFAISAGKKTVSSLLGSSNLGIGTLPIRVP